MRRTIATSTDLLNQSLQLELAALVVEKLDLVE